MQTNYLQGTYKFHYHEFKDMSTDFICRVGGVTLVLDRALYPLLNNSFTLTALRFRKLTKKKILVTHAVIPIPSPKIIPALTPLRIDRNLFRGNYCYTLFYKGHTLILECSSPVELRRKCRLIEALIKRKINLYFLITKTNRK